MAELLPAVLGMVAGLVLGLTGAGGSILALPLLMFGLGWTLPQAAPVALLAVSAAATFGTVVAWDVRFVRYRAALLMSAAGAVAAAFIGPGYDLAATLSFVGGALGGMLAGRMLAPRIAGPRLQGGFAVLMLLTATGLLLQTLSQFQRNL